MTAERTRFPRSQRWRKTSPIASSAQAAGTVKTARPAASCVSQAGSATRPWLAVLCARPARNRRIIALRASRTAIRAIFASRASNCSVLWATSRTPSASPNARCATTANTRTPPVLPVASLAALVTAVHGTTVAAHSRASVLCVHRVTSPIARRRHVHRVTQAALVITPWPCVKAALWESFSRRQA